METVCREKDGNRNWIFSESEQSDSLFGGSLKDHKKMGAETLVNITFAAVVGTPDIAVCLSEPYETIKHAMGYVRLF